MDTLPTDLQECARKSSNDILAKELGNESMIGAPTNGGPAKKHPSAKKPAKPKGSPAMTKIASNLIGETVGATGLLP